MDKYHSKHMTLKTIQHYADNPVGFWEGTRNHDVSQNINALLGHIEGNSPFNILDFGCGPGRDLKAFKDLGHNAIGLEGCEEFCQMAVVYSGCEVYHQNFIDVDLPHSFFDGIFANASLFHVPKNNLSNLDTVCFIPFLIASAILGVIFLPPLTKIVYISIINLFLVSVRVCKLSFNHLISSLNVLA